MKATIDKAGRLVIPRQLRDSIGLRPGEVEVEVVGDGLLIRVLAGGDLVEDDGLLVVPRSGTVMTNDEVLRLRDAIRR
jgi:AbrB family looped-hinge helix DNA binding protein